MYKLIIAVAIFIFLPYQVFLQNTNPKGVNSFYSFVIGSVFCEDTRKDIVIIQRANDFEKLNKIVPFDGMYEHFWDKLCKYLNIKNEKLNIDSAKAIVARATIFDSTICFTGTKKILIADSSFTYDIRKSEHPRIITPQHSLRRDRDSTYEEKLKAYLTDKRAAFFEISNVFFKKENNDEYGLVFYHQLGETGVTLICKKVNDKWTVYKKEYEWIE